jgi:predicted translin family RNA/ssDNA-binding protein
MINKTFLQKLRIEHSTHDVERRKIISAANNILPDAKRAIFAVHRDDLKTAESSIADIEKRLKDLQKNFGYTRLVQEGAYNACVEEYVEAKMFLLVTSGKKVDSIKGIKLSTTSYLGGICDLTGELLRQAVNEAAKGNTDQVKHSKQIIEDVISELIEFNLTSYLRTKYDQARNNLRKIEQINYEINLKR